MRVPELHTARVAYDAIAAVYADQIKDTLDDRPTERALLAAFAEVIRRGPAGLVADLGCGPGQIAAHLHSLGLSVFGVDQSAEMLAIGRTHYPEVRFALSSITRLGGAFEKRDGRPGPHCGAGYRPSRRQIARRMRPGLWRHTTTRTGRIREYKPQMAASK
jgi:SAM-dependent methyltransferase